MSFLMPKMPSPPPLVMPEVREVPQLIDEDREKEQRLALESSERKRKGRRSTILTGSGAGLTEEAELNQPTLLGY
jgi:hypothetical protein